MSTKQIQDLDKQIQSLEIDIRTLEQHFDKNKYINNYRCQFFELFPNSLYNLTKADLVKKILDFGFYAEQKEKKDELVGRLLKIQAECEGYKLLSTFKNDLRREKGKKLYLAEKKARQVQKQKQQQDKKARQTLQAQQKLPQDIEFSKNFIQKKMISVPNLNQELKGESGKRLLHALRSNEFDLNTRLISKLALAIGKKNIKDTLLVNELPELSNTAEWRSYFIHYIKTIQKKQ